MNNKPNFHFAELHCYEEAIMGVPGEARIYLTIIVNEYKGRLGIYYIDAYRLRSLAEFEMPGFDDSCYPQSVVLIE